MFRVIPSPPFFPVCVRHVSAAFDLALADEDEATSLEREDLQAFVRSAVPKRRAEFYAGRRCATLAMASCDAGYAGASVGVGDDRAPRWPEGFVGSITHTAGYAAAAVARASEARGIGIDTEVLIAEATATKVSRAIAAPIEIDRVCDALGVEPRVALTLIFSAKESLFKAVFPLVGQRFYFLDAEVVEVRSDAARLGLCVRRDLGDRFHSGTCLAAVFALEKTYAHTGVFVAHDGVG